MAERKADPNFQAMLDAMFGKAKEAGLTEVWTVTEKNGAFRAVCVMGGHSPIYAPNRKMMDAFLKEKGLSKNPIVGAADIEGWQK